MQICPACTTTSRNAVQVMQLGRQWWQVSFCKHIVVKNGYWPELCFLFLYIYNNVVSNLHFLLQQCSGSRLSHVNARILKEHTLQYFSTRVRL
jgi:hypothetical protein